MRFLDALQNLTRSSSQPMAAIARVAHGLGGSVEFGDPGLDQRLLVGGVIALDGDGVELVGHLVMRVDVARHLQQRRHLFRLDAPSRLIAHAPVGRTMKPTPTSASAPTDAACGQQLAPRQASSFSDPVSCVSSLAEVQNARAPRYSR